MDVDTSVKFSPSKLDTYSNCPRRYRYRYVDKIKREGTSVEAFVGTCVHSAFESLYEGLLHGKTLSLEETLAVFEAGWKEGWSEKVAIRDKQYSAEDWRALGRQCVGLYYKAQAPFDKERTVAVEKRIGFELGVEGESYRIEGFIDRLASGADGAFEIHDYKTSKTLPSQADVDADRQLAVYDIAVRDHWKVPDEQEVRLVWHYVRHGRSLTSRRSPQERAALRDELAALIAAIKHDHDFAPQKTALCDWCEYRDLCPLFAHAEKLRPLLAEQRRQDSGAALVAQLAELDAKKKELREGLKALEPVQKALEDALVKYARAQGLLSVSGAEGEATIMEKEDFKFPTKTHAAEALESLEGELKASPIWGEVSHLDAHRLMDGYKKKAWGEPILALIESLLGRYVKHTKEPVVRFHKKKDAGDD